MTVHIVSTGTRAIVRVPAAVTVRTRPTR